MKKWRLLLLGLLLSGWGVQASAQVIWQEDFEATFTGATSGNNEILTNTVIETANQLYSTVVVPPAAFTSASGTNCILLTANGNKYSSIRPNVKPISFSSVPPTTEYVCSFDLYIPSGITKAVGDFQPRLKLNGVGGNGSTDESMIVSGAGLHHVEYTGQVSDFIATDVNEAWPFIGFDQNTTVVSNFVYMDNLKFEFIPVTSKVWNGDVSDNWDTSTANWQGGLTYANADNVLFDETLDTGSSGIVNISSTLTPASVTVSNAATAYTFNITGFSDLGGVTSLSKKGSGSLTLSGEGTISHSGTTSIQEGELAVTTQIGGNPNSTFSVAGGATLTVQSTGSGTCYVSNLIASASATLKFDLDTFSPSTSEALLESTVLPSATATVSVRVTGGSGWAVGQKYPLIKYNSGNFGGLANLELVEMPAGIFGELYHDAATDTLGVVVVPATLTGPVVSSGFTSGEGYSNVDLAGQLTWMPVSGSSNHAFTVSGSTGQGWADTTPNNVATNVGNAVYVNRLTSNNEDDAWDGSVDFVLSAQGSNFENQQVFSIGVGSDMSKRHLAWENTQALLILHVRSSGNIGVVLANEGLPTDSTRLAELDMAELGWDPKSATAVDSQTDTLNLTFKIRKTRDANTYQASATLSNTVSGVSSETSGTFVTVPGMATVKANLYTSPIAYFTMGHYYKARRYNAGLGGLTDQLDVILDQVNVSHSTNNLPVPTAATELTAVGSDRAVKISWTPAIEATSYDLLMAESEGGLQVTVATNLTGESVTDSPRFNGITNWYAVRANFATGVADSEEVDAAPIPSQSLYNFDGVNREMVTGIITWARPDEGDNGSLFWFGSDTTPVVTNGQASYVGPTLHAFVQNPLNANFGSTIIQNNGDSSSYDDIDYLEVSSQGESPRARQHMLVYAKNADWGNPAPIDLSIESAEINIGSDYCNGDYGMNAAIRNGTQWYISEQRAYAKWTEPQSNIVVNIGGANWAAVNLDVSAAWPNPIGISYSSIDTNSFTDINAVGYYCYEDYKARVNQMILSKDGSTPSFEYWAGSEGVEMTGNTDGDELDNIKEYAFGGDPNVAGDEEKFPTFMAANYMGTNGFIFTHIELRDPMPGIDYSLKTTESLQFPSWDAYAGIEVIGEVEIDYYYKAVTNFVPADEAVKFVDLKVTDQNP